MARLIRRKRASLRKKWEHFKIKFKNRTFKLSLLLNLGCGYYFADKYGYTKPLYPYIDMAKDYIKIALEYILNLL